MKNYERELSRQVSAAVLIALGFALYWLYHHMDMVLAWVFGK
jgi:hypothetical protein